MQQDPDRLTADAGDQSAFYRLLRDQADGPTCRARGGRRTDHRDDALLVRGREHLRRAGPRGIKHRARHAARLIPPGQAPNRLRRQVHRARHLRRQRASVQVQQRQHAEDHPHLLHPAVQHPRQLRPVARTQSKRHWRSWHTHQTPTKPPPSPAVPYYLVGRRPSGRIDLLAKGKDGKFVVIELKLSRGRNKTLGQILHYMGWADKELGNAPCRGYIVANSIPDDLRLAVSRVPGVKLAEYKLSFSIKPV